MTLESDGRHLLTDVWTSIGVIIGVARAARLGRRYGLDETAAREENRRSASKVALLEDQ